MKAKSERGRLAEIVSVFIRRGLGRHWNNPHEIRLAFMELGPAFIKLGQLLSIRYDLLPEAYLLEFRKLQDEASPVPFPVIREIVEENLHGSLGELFESFDEEPLASASIAQVHAAVLAGGRRVAVKVQRPGIEPLLLTDLKLLRRLAQPLKLAPGGRVVDPVAVVDELIDVTRRELDFLHEADNLERFRRNNPPDGYVTCPEIYRAMSTGKVLVMENIEGAKLERRELQARGCDPKDIGLKLAQNYFKQIFDDGFFHADPHPGNLRLREGRLYYLDFGITGELTEAWRAKLNRFINGVATGDVGLMAQAALQLGTRRGPVETDKLRGEIRRVYRDYIDTPLEDLELAGLFRELLHICMTQNIAMPREMITLFKGIAIMEGVLAELSPGVNLAKIALPFVKKRLHWEERIPAELREWLLGLPALARAGRRMPLALLDLIESILAGEFRMQLEHVKLEKSVAELNRMANRVVFSLILASLIIGSSLIINANVGPTIYGVSAFGLIGFLGAAIMGVWLLVSILRSGMM